MTSTTTRTTSSGRDPAPTARATPRDLRYVVALQKRFSQELGFLPEAALEEKVRRGQVWLASENGEPAGYLCHGSLSGPEVKIFQAAIQYDARRRHLGLALVEGLVGRARSAGAMGISLRCLSELDANAFWDAAGFRLVATEQGAKGRLKVWIKELAPEAARAGPLEQPRIVGAAGSEAAADAPFVFSTRSHPCPACGRPTVDTWTRGAKRWALCGECIREKC